MKAGKKKYESPRLKTYGCVESLTQMKEGYGGEGNMRFGSDLIKLIEPKILYR